MKEYLLKKINHICQYLLRLDIQTEDTNDETYKKLINEEIEFYKNKLIEYSKLYEKNI